MQEAQTARHRTLVQAQRDEEDGIFRLFEGDFTGVSQFLLDKAFLIDRAIREEKDDHIRSLNGFFDFQAPILAGQQLLLIQPGVNPAFGGQSPRQFLDEGLVLGGVREKNFERALGFGHIRPVLCRNGFGA